MTMQAQGLWVVNTICSYEQQENGISAGQFVSFTS